MADSKKNVRFVQGVLFSEEELSAATKKTETKVDGLAKTVESASKSMENSLGRVVVAAAVLGEAFLDAGEKAKTGLRNVVSEQSSAMVTDLNAVAAAAKEAKTAVSSANAARNAPKTRKSRSGSSNPPIEQTPTAPSQRPLPANFGGPDLGGPNQPLPSGSILSARQKYRLKEQEKFRVHYELPAGENPPVGGGGFLPGGNSMGGVKRSLGGDELPTAEKQAEAARIAKAKADEEFAKQWIASSRSDAKKQEADYAKSQKKAADAEKKKADAAAKFSADWIKSANANRQKQEADAKKAADVSAKAAAAKAAADKKFADDWIREQKENQKKQERDQFRQPTGTYGPHQAAGPPVPTPQQQAAMNAAQSMPQFGPAAPTPAQQAKMNAANAAANSPPPPGPQFGPAAPNAAQWAKMNAANAPKPSSRFGDRQEAYDDATEKIRKGRGLFGVDRSLTAKHLESAYGDADKLIVGDFKAAKKEEIKQRKAGAAAAARGDTAAAESAKLLEDIAAEDKRTLKTRRKMNAVNAAKAIPAQAALDKAQNVLADLEASGASKYKIQAAQTKLAQAHRENERVRNPNAASKGFGGQNLTFAAQQAAYGVEDFFQVLAAGQSPVRAFLGAANNIGPALALVGVGGTAASVGIASLLAVTALYDIASKKAKKSTEGWKDSIDRLADSMGKVEKIRGRSSSGSISEDILKISGDPMAVNAEINKLKAQMNRMEKESIPDKRDPNRAPLPAVGNYFKDAFSGFFESIGPAFGDTFARLGLEEEKYEPKGRFNAPKNFSQAAKENPKLWNFTEMSELDRVRARKHINELQAKFDKEKEAGVYKELEALLKELDDSIKGRAELVRQATENPNSTSDELMQARNQQARTGRPVFGEAVSRASERLQGNEAAIKEAKERVRRLGPELKEKLDVTQAAYNNLTSKPEKERRTQEYMTTKGQSRILAEFNAQRDIEQESQKLVVELEIRRKAYEKLNAEPEALQLVADAERAKFKRALGIAGAGLRNFSQMLPGVVNEGLFRLDDIKQSRGALKESFNDSSAGDQQTILKQLDNAARPKGTAQVMGVEGLYNTIQTSLLNNDPSLEVEKQIRDEIKALRDDLARGAKFPGSAMGGMIRGYAEGGRGDARDTIPARLRPGEVVLTPQQQERLGQNNGKRSAEMFGEAGVPGFAGGGGFGWGAGSGRGQLWFDAPDYDKKPVEEKKKETRPTVNKPQHESFGAGPAIPSAAPQSRSYFKKSLTPFQQRNEQLKASRKRQQEAVAAKNAEREKISRRSLFVGPLPTLGQLRAGGNSQNHYGAGERLYDQHQDSALSQRAQDSMKRASGVGADESSLKFLRKKMLEPRTGGETSEMEFTMPGPRSQGTKGMGANASSSKSTATYTQPLGPDFREMAKEEHLKQMQRRGMSQKAQDATGRLYAEPKTDSQKKVESDTKRAGMLARKNASDAAKPKEEEKPEPWSFGSLKSGIIPRTDYGSSRGTRVGAATKRNSWMDKATPEFSHEASTLMNKDTGRYTKGTSQREKQVAGRLSDMPTSAKPNYSARGNTEYEGWKAGQDEVKGMPKIEYGKDALKAQEDRMNRLGIGGGSDVSSKGMEVSLKDGLDNSKVLTDILRTLNEKLGMISNGVGQTVGAIQNMETGLLA
jgi:hypothetical protein